MILSDAQLEEFQELYRTHLGLEISKQEAYEKGIKLVRLMKLVYIPMTKKEFIFYQKMREEIVFKMLSERLGKNRQESEKAV